MQFSAVFKHKLDIFHVLFQCFVICIFSYVLYTSRHHIDAWFYSFKKSKCVADIEIQHIRPRTKPKKNALFEIGSNAFEMYVCLCVEHQIELKWCQFKFKLSNIDKYLLDINENISNICKMKSPTSYKYWC